MTQQPEKARTLNLPTLINEGQFRVLIFDAFSLLGEYVLNSQKLRNGTTNRSIKNDAWNAIATYVIIFIIT